MLSIDDAEAHIRDGMDAARSGDFDAAAESFRLATLADPMRPNAHNNLGSALAALGQHADAVAAFAAAVELVPAYPQALTNLGDSLQALGRSEEAFHAYLRAIEADAGYGPAYYGVGHIHRASVRLNEALACYRHAAELSPQDPEIQTALGGILMQLRREEEAIAAFGRALVIDPTMEVPRTHLMHLLAKDCDWERLQPHLAWVPQLGIFADIVPPFSLLAFEDHPLRHRTRSARFAVATYAHVKPLPTPPRVKARPEKLRIGYFSADFREHATMFLAARLFELHDRERFIVHAYSYGRNDAGSMRERARNAFDDFKDVQGLSDREIAEVARADGIDVAVDLKGYTEENRVGVLAHRPAPVQLTFLGYPGTLDARFIDYLVADPVVTPSDQREAYGESLILLPHSYQCNDDSRRLPEPLGGRADHGLPAEGFVFCCFNNSYKITPAEFGIWMELLKAVDGSTLWLLAGTANVARNLRAEAEKRGVEPSRLVFAPKVALPDHLARQKFADLFLDTFNCNAHTTASDALWAGLPIVTKAGQGFAARVAASLLNAAGLPELVTKSDEDYAALALALAKDPARLASLRARLAANQATAPLFDSALFTRHFEAGLDLAYQRYVERQEPADIIVPA